VGFLYGLIERGEITPLVIIENMLATDDAEEKPWH